jgi:hypothetical protein
VVKTHDTYSGDLGFKSRPGDRLSWLRLLCFSSVPPGKFLDRILKLGYDYFLTYPFQFFFYL